METPSEFVPKSGSVKQFTARRAFAFVSPVVLSHIPSVNPTHRHDSLFGNACSLADRDHIIAYPLIHFLVLTLHQQKVS